MKKRYLLLLLLLTITGCSKNQEKVQTIIENNDNTMISIHYPITNINKIDKKIQKYANQEYLNFKNIYSNSTNLKAELNIDYTYFIYENKIHSISLKTYINSYAQNTPIEDTLCITYDTKEKKELYLKDIIEENNWSEFISTIRKKLIEDYKSTINFSQLENNLDMLNNQYKSFAFDEQNLTLYLKNDNWIKNQKKIIPISLNLTSIPCKITAKNKTEKAYENIQRVDSIIDPNKPVIALTFDDGPTNYTEEILKILKQENVVATFFVLGNKVEAYQETLRNLTEAGNEIGNHSYNHKWLSRLSEKEIQFQIEKTQENIKSITGTYPKLLRPTYGSINNRIRRNTDLKIVLWDIDPKDWKNQTPEVIVQNIIDKVKDEKIILLHDNHKRTVKAIQILIPKLKEQGYQFVTVSELEEIKILKKF